MTKAELSDFEVMEALCEKLQAILPEENIIRVSSKDCVGLQDLASRSRDIIIGEIFTVDEPIKQRALG